MYAIIRTGGKQQRVQQGDVIDVELLNEEEGSEVDFPEVLFVHDGTTTFIGAPTLSSFKVKGKVLGRSRGKKVKSMKYQRRQNERYHLGHRQHYNRVEITGIQAKTKKTTQAAKGE